VYPDFSFRGFRHRGASNPHGWGLAWFDEHKKWQVIKRAGAANRSTLVSSLLKRPPGPSRTFLGHVRYASKGQPLQKNAHPFTHPFDQGEVAMIHNGTLNDLPPTRRNPKGTTDSEHLLCTLLDRLEERNTSFGNTNEVESIFLDINNYGTLNAVVSNGSLFYAYRDKNGYSELHQTFRMPPLKETQLLDDDLSLDLSRIKEPGTFGYVLATRPLTDEQWKPLPRGKVIRYGTPLKNPSNIRNTLLA
jgi:glutamine amidotransferase